VGSWSALLVALSGPLARRVLISLGIGFFVSLGLGGLQSQVAVAVGNGWSGLPSSSYQILAMAGVIDSVNVWLSALAVVAASAAVKRLGVINS